VSAISAAPKQSPPTAERGTKHALRH